MIVVFIASLFAAFLNAASSIMQRRVTGQVDAKELFRGSILRNVVRKRLWLGGVVLQVAAFFAQAVALHNGSLVMVEPLMTTDLIFMLVIIHFYLGNRIQKSGWIAMIAVAAGLSGLLAAAEPHGGHTPIGISNWIIVFAAIGTAIVVGANITRSASSSGRRAAIGGITAGAHFGLTAAMTKLVIEQFHLGFGQEFLHWPLYALIVIGVSSAISMQSMYGAGSLAVSQPALEIAEALQGVLIGVWVFGDSINTSAAALAVEAVSALVLALGIIMLGRADDMHKPGLMVSSKVAVAKSSA